MTILFSAPVHESNPVVINTLNNVRKYNPGCIFVLHVSTGFKDFDFSVGNAQDVLINPIRFHTIHSGTSHVPLYFTNYKHAVDCGAKFDYICPLHTSEMFIKFGLEDYIKNYEYSLWFNENTQPIEMAWTPLRISYQHKIFKDLFNSNNIHNYLGNLIEGNWWKRELFEKMFQWTKQRYNIMDMAWGYPCEEVYFNTLSHHLSDTKNYSHPYNCFHHKTHLVDNFKDVDDVRDNKMSTFWQPNNWTYQKVPFPSKNLYSIKRIGRKLDDPIRMYINSLDA